MPEDFLTIKQAAAHTGKAEITIRRFVQRIVKGNDQRQRALLKPSEAELARHTDGPPPAWRISTRLLREQFPTEREQSAPPAESPQPTNDDGSIVAMLKLQNATLEKQLNVKDDQIRALTTLVNSMGNQLNERLRESNVLMKGLQERLTLPERSTKPTVPSSATKTDATPSAKQGNEPTRSKSATPQPKRTGVFGRWFRS